MNEFLTSLEFSVTIILPNVLLLLLGVFLRQQQFIDDKFCDQSSKVLFHCTLPLLLFLGIISNKIDFSAQFTMIAAGVTGTLLLYFTGEFIAAKTVEKKQRAIVTQAFFRGNAGILGVALCSNAYGHAGIATAAVYVAAIVFLFNILSVITLTNSLTDNQKLNITAMFLQLAKNPLIIGITIAIIFNTLELTLPKPLHSTANYVANMTMPLALICAGASLNLKKTENPSYVAIWSALARNLVAPITLVVVGLSFGLKGIELGVIFLITATPLAAAAYPMVRSMGGDAKLTANIIGLTTIGSMFTVAIGSVILKQFNLM
ncbi:hypothetical protein EDC44_10737 [Cricetibacter osteomyelitidis]|uniref:Malonate transporter n=1 Tax=Cricetibacter osteomyelitidis TaxID=1521931 RepID=A0A4R2T3E5_9PAST|nr:AEC family transporter [Cricetibacter osteomyelitidis]TCP95756.1 hypothetical protein EDC44_10737 [Cricetibacter osteomyelitidis]